MEYLVTMTTHVPNGTPDQAVAEVRAREAARSSDGAQLEQVLASMPLRAWHTDEVAPLVPHPNDPGLPATAGAAEFLTTSTIAVLEGTPDRVVASTEAREAQQAGELAAHRHLLRLWQLPAGGPSALGLWHAHDLSEMKTILESLPLATAMTVQTTPLTPHPSDPGPGAS